MTTLTGNWNYPTSIKFGAGRIVELPDHCRALGMQRPLLVTDAGLAGLPMIGNAVHLCREAGLPCEVFSDVQPNPVEANVSSGVAALKDDGHDGVIAFGGGSALDTAKAIALMAGQVRPIWDFEDREDWYTRVNVAGMLPVVAVPTTAGTGSEVGRASVITDLRDHTKKIMAEPGEVLFWRIAMRPGRPMAIGRIGTRPGAEGRTDEVGRQAILFGLPGNPVAVMVTFYAFVREALLRMAGATPEPMPLLHAASAEPIRKKPGRTEYQRGIVTRGGDGQWQVRITGAQGSGILRSMSQANGMVLLHHGQGSVKAGDMVDVIPFDALL